MTLALVILGGAVGAVLRFATNQALATPLGARFPGGTFTVNVTGSLLLGGLVGAAHALPPHWHALLGTGLAGALSTYSAFSYETVRLARAGSHRHAGFNIAGNLLVGLAAAAVGIWLGRVLAG